MSNIFTIYKSSNIDLKEYISSWYGFEWKANKILCPFHDDAKPSLSYNPKNNTFKCMVCGTGGDLVNFVEQYEKITNIEAVKRILANENIHFEDNQTQSTLSDEEKQIQDLENQKRKEELEKQKAIKKEQLQKSKNETIVKLTSQAPALANSLYDVYPKIYEEIIATFPNQSAIFSDWRDIYLGYDNFHESICILNRTHTPNTCFNIKHKQKWLWDAEKKEYDTNTRADGKWISSFNSTLSPFPFEYFKQNQDNRVIICEGEKDALNLLSYDISVLTLGGVTNSWNDYKEILKDKVVYIWFDNDSAGYLESLKKFREIEDTALATYIVLFYNINNALPQKYDISDFLKDKKFKSKEDIFNAIAFSSFILNNELVDDIAEHIDVNIREFDDKRTDGGKKIYQLSPLKDFEEIRKIFIKTDVHGQAINVVKVKGELDDKEVDIMINNFKQLDKNKVYREYKDMALNAMLVGADDKEKRFEELEKIFIDFANIKQTLLTNYRQTHLVDMIQAFRKMASHTVIKMLQKHELVISNNQYIA